MLMNYFKELNKFRFFYGMKVKKDKRNDMLFYVLDAKKHKCMYIEIEEDDENENVKMFIHSLKFEKKESKCSVQGRKLVEWAKSFVPHVVSSVELIDASYKIIKSSTKTLEIPLLLVMKFIKGKSWYEQLGFRMKIKEAEFFDQCFQNLRELKYRDLVQLLLTMLKPFLDDDLNDMIPENLSVRKLTWGPPYTPEFDNYSAELTQVVSSWPSEKSSCIILTPLNFLTNWQIPEFVKRRDYKASISIKKIVELLNWHGIPEEFIVNPKLVKKSFSEESVGQVLAPRGSRKIFEMAMYDSESKEEFVDYMDLLINFLNCMLVIGVLQYSGRFQYP